MDNSPFHRAKKVRDYCETNKIKVIFNAPYTPDFNPIENLFCLWKKKVHTQIYICFCAYFNLNRILKSKIRTNLL